MKKFLCSLLAAVFAFSLTSCATGEPYLKDCHYSLAGITDGKADFSNARFHRVWLQIEDYDTTATEAHLTATGTLTLEGGTYSIWNGTEIEKVDGETKTFQIVAQSSMQVGGEIEYELLYNGQKAHFLLEADDGLNGVHATWEFPDLPSMNGAGTIANFKTTEEQINNAIPYFEFTMDGDNVTGLSWSLVKSPDLETAISQDFNSQLKIDYVTDKDFNNIYRGNFVWFDAGNALEGTVTFDEPVVSSDIWRIRIRYFTYENDNENRYEWRFFSNLDENTSYMWNRHTSNASLINGKSDYSDAKFLGIYLTVDNDNTINEAKFIEQTGTITIPGGGYTVKNYSSGEDIESVTSGTDKDFTVKIKYFFADASDYEFSPIDDSGNVILFAGGAEKGFNGKEITWTFPEEWNIDGSATIPNYKSVAEQLADFVPYLEITSADNAITSIKYKLVKSNDVSTTVTPSNNFDIAVRIPKKESDFSGTLYNSDWINNSTSGTLELSSPISLSDVNYVAARIRVYEDADNPAVYQWNFYPAEAPQDPGSITITNSSLASGVVGNYYLESLKSNSSDVTWSKTGNLPLGLTLSSQGVISGTPTASGTSNFNITATSNDLSVSKDFSIVINPLAVTTSTLPDGKINEDYSASLASNGSNLSWVVASGTLPDGLTLNNAVISGKPTAAKEYSFTIRAYNSYASATKDFTIKIEANAPAPVGGGGGGCLNIGFEFFGLGILAVLILKRK